MNSIRVLVLGGTGMLGHKLVQVLGEDEALDVHCTVRSVPEAMWTSQSATYHAAVDATVGSTSIGGVIEAVRPDVIINAIGAIKQKDLHAHLDETFFLNGTLPHMTGLLAGSAAKLIHLSTDCVFKGDRGAYTENDVPDVEDLYGRSKACGEVAYGRHLTLRTSIIGFEMSGHLGLVSWLLRQPAGSTLKGFTHAIYSGLPTVVLSHTIHDIIRHHSQLTGLYHVASKAIDKFDLLQRLNEALGLGHEILPDGSMHMDRSLEDTPFRQATGTVRPDWDELVQTMVDDYRTRPYDVEYQRLRAAHSPATKA